MAKNVEGIEDAMILLQPDGGDVAGSAGDDRVTYPQTAETIKENLDRLLDQLGIATPAQGA